MQRISLLLPLLLFIWGCSQTETPPPSLKEGDTFIIYGTTNEPNASMVLFQQTDISKNETKKVKDIKIKEDGSFEAHFTVEPHFYKLSINGQKEVVLLPNQGEVIHLQIEGNQQEDISINGSPDTQLYLDYEFFRKQSLERLVLSVRKQISIAKKSGASPEEIEKLTMLEMHNYQKHKQELMTFVQKKMGHSLAIYPSSIRWIGDEYLPFLKDLNNQFSNQYKGLSIAKKVTEKITLLENTSIGSQAININMTNLKGENISLSDFKGKYVLIDFWASWCGPCRQENKNLKKLYETYQDKGFELYAIALDEQKARWEKATIKDQVTWTNVSSIQKFTTPAAVNYGVTALPMNFLIDPSGKIIAKDLHGEALKQKIESLF